MRKALAAAIVGLAAIAAGCGPATLESVGQADFVAALPGGVPLAGASGDYRFSAGLGYAGVSIEDMGMAGLDADISVFGATFTWYFMGPVKNDETAIALQPVVQMASDLSAELRLGTMEFNQSAYDDSDLVAWLASLTFVTHEGSTRGFGVELSTERQTIDDIGGSGSDLKSATLDLALLYYIPGVTGERQGLIARLGWLDDSQDEGAVEKTLSGVELGARYYREVVRSQWVDASLTLGFLSFEETGSSDDDATRIALRAAYYPMKFLGVGVSWSQDGYDEYDSNDEDSFGAEVLWSVEQVPGLDLSLSWEKSTQNSSPEEKDTMIFFMVGYRF